MRARESAWWSTAGGGALATVGLGLTVATFLSSEGGSGTIFHGMIVVGGIWLARGMIRLRAIDALPPIRTDEPSPDDDDDE